VNEKLEIIIISQAGRIILIYASSAPKFPKSAVNLNEEKEKKLEHKNWQKLK